MSLREFMDHLFAPHVTVITHSMESRIEWYGAWLAEACRRDRRVHLVSFLHSCADLERLVALVRSGWQDHPTPQDSDAVLRALDHAVIDPPVSRRATCLLQSLEVSPRDAIFLIGGDRLAKAGGAEFGVITFERSFRTGSLEIYDHRQTTYEYLIPHLHVAESFSERMSIPIVILVQATEQSSRKLLDLISDRPGIDLVHISRDGEHEEATPLGNLICDPGTRGEVAEDSQTTVLSSCNRALISALAYLRAGRRREAIDELLPVQDTLWPEQRHLLGAMLTSEGRNREALAILKATFDVDPWLHGLVIALIHAAWDANDMEEAAKWIQVGMQQDREDVAVLEMAADLANRRGDYRTASQLRREAHSLSKNPQHELIARFLDLVAEPPKEPTDGEKYIKGFVIQYPELEDDANYRMGIWWLHKCGSAWKARECWERIPPDPGRSCAYDAALQRLLLLSDPENSSKAFNLKPFRSADHAERLATRRTCELLKDMHLLSLRQEGMSVWRNFIARAQSPETWAGELGKALVCHLDVWSQLGESTFRVPSHLLPSNDRTEKASFLPSDAVRVIRDLRSSEPPDWEERILACMAVCETHGSAEERIWARYEAGVIYMMRGEIQKANDHALTLMLMGGMDLDVELSKQAGALGLVAWGNTQLRVGNIPEGAAALIAGVDAALACGELACTLEGFGALRFWQLQGPDPSQTALRLTRLIGQVKRTLNPGTTHDEFDVEEALDAGDWEGAYSYLSSLFAKEGLQVGDRSVDFAFLISVCIKSGRGSEARSLLREHGLRAAEFLAARQDARPKALLGWAQILVHSGSDESDQDFVHDLQVAWRLLECAANDVEKKRESVRHDEERAAVGREAQEVFRWTALVAALVQCLDVTPPNVVDAAHQAIYSSLCALSPRSIIEHRHYSPTPPRELRDLEAECLRLQDELMRRETVQSGGGPERVDASRDRWATLRERLILEHPTYRGLPVQQPVDLDIVRSNLQPREAFYTLAVVPPLGAVSLLITCDRCDFGFRGFRVDHVMDMVQKLARQVQGGSTVAVGREGETICEILSEVFFAPVLIACKEEAIDRLFVSPDSSLPLFSPALVRGRWGWLIEKLEAVVSTLGPGHLLESGGNVEDTHEGGVLMAIGSPATRGRARDAVEHIRHWAHRKTAASASVRVVEDWGPQNSCLIETVKQMKPALLVMAGHGISDPVSEGINGSLAVKGSHETLWPEDLTRACASVPVVVLLSCSGGTPIAGHEEPAAGMWRAALGTRLQTVITCRWDVEAEPSCIALDPLVDYVAGGSGGPVLHASQVAALLHTGQRDVLRQSRWGLSHWAGLECWGGIAGANLPPNA